MVRAGATAAAIGVALALGAAGWLVWSTGGAGGADPAEEGFEGRGTDGRDGPVLSGHEGVRPLSTVPIVDGEFDILGRVVDEDDRPLAGVPVTARRTGDAREQDDLRDWEAWNRAQRGEDFAVPKQAWKDAPVDASGASGADGAFTLRVRRRGEYSVRAEPAAPLVGTRQEWVQGRTSPPRPLRLRVLRGSALSGRVVEAGDRGVEAFVRALRTEEQPTWTGAWTPTEAGTGRFALEAVPDGALEFEVLVPGRLKVSGWPVKTPTTAEVVLRLGGSARLAIGSVSDLAGQPVPGARVAVSVQATLLDGGRSVPVDARLLAVSDDAGAFALEGGVTGRVTEVEVDAAGFLHHHSEPPLAPWSGLTLDATREASLAIVLWKGGAMEGRVLERGSGKPLAGAIVEAHPSAVDGRLTAPPVRHAVSDASGRYVVEGLPVGRSLVSVRHPTHFFQPLEVLQARGEVSHRNFNEGGVPPPTGLVLFVAQEGQRVARDLELVKGVPLSGRVVDGKGTPVEGAEVVADGMGLGDEAWSWNVSSGEGTRTVATSGPDGRFAVAGLPPRKEWTLYARKAPFFGERCLPFPLTGEGATPEIELRLVKGVTLEGRVLDEHGTPVPRAQISTWTDGSDEGQSYVGVGGSGEANVTDATGAFHLEETPKGRVHVYAWAEGIGSGSRMVEGMEPGDVRTDVDVRLERTAKALLRGVLVDEAGAPARGKDLVFTLSTPDGSNSTQTSSNRRDGSFEVDLGAGRIRISGGDYENQTTLLEVDAPAADVRVVWKDPPQRIIEGLVVDAQGRPVPLCTVEVRGAARTEESDGEVWYSDDESPVVNGWFRRQVNDRAPFTVKVGVPQDAAGAPLNLKGKTVTLREPPDGPVTITLEPGSALAGSVVDAGGRGVAQVPVQGGGVGTVTDDAGAFLLGGLGTEPVQVEAVPSSPWIRPAAQTATPGGEPLVIVLKEGLVVAGQVKGAKGTSLSGSGRVQAKWEEGRGGPAGSADAWLQREGRFRIEGVPEGALVTLDVQIWRSGARSYANRTVTGVVAGTQDVVIDLAAGAEVSGVVQDAEGRPFTSGNVTLTFSSADGNARTTYVRIGSEGEFQVLGLPAGSVAVGLHRYDGGPLPAPVQVQAPASGVRLVLPATLPIRGRLVGAGDAVTKYRVWAWKVPEEGAKEDENNENDALASVAVAADGTFSLDSAGAGRWMVAAGAKGEDRYALVGPVDAGGAHVTLKLGLGASIEGTLVNPDGSPLPRHASVSLSGNHWNAEATPDAEGRFVLRGLPAGRYDVHAYTWEDGYTSAYAEGIESGRKDLRLELKRQKD